MKKKVAALAAAVVALPSAVVLADDSSVSLYGTLNVDIESVRASGATAAGADIQRRTRVSSNSSNIGFRGIEPLRQGLNAWFQVESSGPLDTGAGAGTWASRNSGVGLNGKFGVLLLGQWDSPYRNSTLRLDPFGGTTIAGYQDILGGNALSTLGNTGISFDRRMRNTFQYWSPILAGFSARFAYGANEEKPADDSSNPRSRAASLAYDNRGLYLTGAYEAHKDFGIFNPALPLGRDTGYKFAASYTIASALTLSGIYETLHYKTDTPVVPGLTNERKFHDWWLSGTYKTGRYAFSLSYGQKDKNKDNGVDVDQTKAQYHAARYGFLFSKRTELYAFYVNVKNQQASRNDFVVGVNPLGADGQGGGVVPAGRASALPAGADPQGVGVGLIHRF